LQQAPLADEPLPTEQGLKPKNRVDREWKCIPADEPLPTEQGMKLPEPAADPRPEQPPMSRFQQNKD